MICKKFRRRYYLALFLAVCFFLFGGIGRVKVEAQYCSGDVGCDTYTNQSDCLLDPDNYGVCLWTEPTPTPTIIMQTGIATTSAYLIDIASNSAVAEGLHNFFFEQIAFDIIVVGLLLWLIIAHYVRST